MKGSCLAEGNCGPCRNSGLSPSPSAVREAWTSERGLLAEEAREGRRVPIGPGSSQGTQTPGRPSVLGGSLFKPLSKEPVILTAGSTL